MKILLTDDHAVVRHGLKQILADEFKKATFGEARNAQEALNKIWKEEWDVVVLDITMPGRSGLEVLREIKKSKPKLPVLVLSMHPEDQYAVRALKAGARAYLLKGLLRKELLETIRLVHAGQKRILPEVANELAEHATDGVLSSREVEVLRLIAGGNANKEIAVQLFITEETVKGHIKNILAKLDANDRTHAVTIGLKRGIIDL